MIRNFFNNIKKGIDYVYNTMSIEVVFSNLLLFFNIIFPYSRITMYIFLAFLVSLFVFAGKFVRKTHLKTFFSYNLVKWGRQNIVLLFFAVANVLVFLILVQSVFGGIQTFLQMSNKTFLLISILIRVTLLFEEIYVQNWTLTTTIDDINQLGEIIEIPDFANQRTVESLISLDNISDSITQSIEEKMKSERLKTELITNISHDLKTPLTSIINYADILSKKDIMDEEAKSYINILGRNSYRLKTLIVDLIDASKTETGNIKVENSFIEFNELVSQIYGDFDGSFQSKNLEFIYSTDVENLVIYSDGNLLSRIIQNLLSNANKYSLENTRVYGRTYSDNEKIYFSIKNVSKKKLNMSADELIEQFIRGEKSRTTDGSGLGLHITRNLVEILGGEFRIVIDGDYFQVFVELPRGKEE